MTDPDHPQAGDPVLDLHVGGKLAIRSTVGLPGPSDLTPWTPPGGGAPRPSMTTVEEQLRRKLALEEPLPEAP